MNQVIDTARQFGLFASGVDGSPVEIGERPGQADLFNRVKYRLDQAASEKREIVGSRNASDPVHTASMFK